MCFASPGGHMAASVEHIDYLAMKTPRRILDHPRMPCRLPSVVTAKSRRIVYAKLEAMRPGHASARISTFSRSLCLLQDACTRLYCWSLSGLLNGMLTGPLFVVDKSLRALGKRLVCVVAGTARFHMGFLGKRSRSVADSYRR